MMLRLSERSKISCFFLVNMLMRGLKLYAGLDTEAGVWEGLRPPIFATHLTQTTPRSETPQPKLPNHEETGSTSEEHPFCFLTF